jgi:HD-GYP domain-containing protein (c-di-GMP phosphodiesterase class II)
MYMHDFAGSLPTLTNTTSSVPGQVNRSTPEPAQRETTYQPSAGPDKTGAEKATAEKKATSETSSPMEVKIAKHQAKIADGVRFSSDLKNQIDQNRQSIIKQRHFREELERMYSSFVNHEPTPEEIANAAKHASYSIWDVIKKVRREGEEEEDEEFMAAKALAFLLKIHSDYTFEHSERVSDWSVALAEELGIDDEEELENLEQAAFFRDIGTVGTAVERSWEISLRIQEMAWWNAAPFTTSAR